jgi:hypothetical protein
MTTVTQLALKQLQKARERLTPREAWIKGEFARSKDRMPVNSASPLAVCWCSVGALNAARGDVIAEHGEMHSLGGDQKARHLLRSVTFRPIAQFNDSPYTTHEDVLGAFDKAIAMAKGTV